MNSKSTTPCNDCKDTKWRVFVQSIGNHSIDFVKEAVITALMEHGKFSKPHAIASAFSLNMFENSTMRDILIFSGEQEQATNILDHLIQNNILVGITNSKEVIK